MPRDPETLKFTSTHEWVDVSEGDIEGDIYTVGITRYAVDQLTDITMVEMPTVGTAVTTGKGCVLVETVKAVSDVYSPVDGEVIAVNFPLMGDVEILYKDPYGDGWMFKVRPADKSQIDHLMNHQQYLKSIEDH